MMIKLFEQFNLLDPYGEEDWIEFEYNENLSREEKIDAIKKEVNKSIGSAILVDTDKNGQVLVYSENSDHVYIIDILCPDYIVVAKYALDDDSMNFVLYKHIIYEKVKDEIINKICSFLFE